MFVDFNDSLGGASGSLRECHHAGPARAASFKSVFTGVEVPEERENPVSEVQQCWGCQLRAQKCFARESDVSLCGPRERVQSGLQRGPAPTPAESFVHCSGTCLWIVVGFCNWDDQICRAELSRKIWNFSASKNHTWCQAHQLVKSKHGQALSKCVSWSEPFCGKLKA